MIRDRLAQSAPGGKEAFRATAALKENRDLRVSKGFLVRPALKDSKEIAAVPDHRENRAPSVRQGPKASVAKAALKVRQDPRVSGVKPALRVNLALRDPRARHLPSLWELSPPVLPQPSPPIRRTPGSPWTSWFPSVLQALRENPARQVPRARKGLRASGAKPALRDLRARHLPSLWELSPLVLPQPSPPIRQTPGSPWTLWFPLAPRGRKVNLVKLDPKDRRASLGRLLKLQWSKIYLLSTRFGLKLRRQIS